MKTGFIKIVVSLWWIALVASAKGEMPESEWLKSKRMEIERIDSLERTERIKNLSSYLIAMDRYDKNINRDHKIIYNLAQKKIMEIPGVDKYFKDRIQEIKSTLRGAGRESEYDTERLRAIEAMRHIPLPEIVSVLGETLEDGEDQPSMHLQMRGEKDHVANNKMAVSALWRMIEKPPVQGKPTFYRDDDVEIWKLWYAQVKAGTRGFQFKGDSTVHYLAKPTGTRPPPSARWESEPPTQERKEVSAPEPEKPADRPFPWIPAVVASSLLLLSAGWLILSKRRANWKAR